jgi:hypothetical protein
MIGTILQNTESILNAGIKNGSALYVVPVVKEADINIKLVQAEVYFI